MCDSPLAPSARERERERESHEKCQDEQEMALTSFGRSDAARKSEKRKEPVTVLLHFQEKRCHG